MSKETDKKLHEELLEKQYRQENDNQNRYWKQNENGGYTEVSTDGQWYGVGNGPWQRR